MTALTVNQLVDLLAKEIAAGHGNHDVLVTLPTADAALLELLDRHNWEIRDLTAERRDGFIVLHGYAD